MSSERFRWFGGAEVTAGGQWLEPDQRRPHKLFRGVEVEFILLVSLREPRKSFHPRVTGSDVWFA